MTPARGATVSFLDAAGQPIVSGTTDARGRFEVSIPPGHYRVSVSAFGFDSPIIMSATGADTKTKPVFVDVSAGKTARLDLVVDTGIR